VCKAIINELTKKGWKVIRIWECEIKKGEFRKLMAADLFSGKESGTIKKRLTKRAATVLKIFFPLKIIQIFTH